MGILPLQMLFVSEETKPDISVAMYPGETELARANLTHSTARDLPNPSVSLIKWSARTYRDG